MPTIVSHVRLAVDWRAVAPNRVVEQWAEVLKLNAQRINEKRALAIPDEETYQGKLAKNAQAGFAPFVNPSYTSEKGLTGAEIISKQGANLRDSYLDYKESLENAFATVDGITAKRFKEQIDASKNEFARGTAQRALAFTGLRVGEFGPAPLAARWLAGEAKIVGKLRPADRVLEGGPFSITVLRKRSSLKATLVQRLIQAGGVIIRASLSPTVITSHNDLTNSLVQGFVDPALGIVPFTTGGLSHVDYLIDHDDLWLDVQISRV